MAGKGLKLTKWINTRKVHAEPNGHGMPQSNRSLSGNLNFTSADHYSEVIAGSSQVSSRSQHFMIQYTELLRLQFALLRKRGNQVWTSRQAVTPQWDSCSTADSLPSSRSACQSLPFLSDIPCMQWLNTRGCQTIQQISEACART